MTQNAPHAKESDIFEIEACFFTPVSVIMFIKVIREICGDGARAKYPADFTNDVPV